MRIMNFIKSYFITFIAFLSILFSILTIIFTADVNAKANCECKAVISCPSGGVTPTTCLTCVPAYQPAYCYCQPSSYLICLRSYLEKCSYTGGDPNGNCVEKDCQSGCGSKGCVTNCGPCAKYEGTCPKGDPYSNNCNVMCKYVYVGQVDKYPS